MIQLSERFGTTWWGRLWITALEQLGVRPDYILNTHHHWDHTGWVQRRSSVCWA